MVAGLMRHPVDEEREEEDADCEKGDVDGVADVLGVGCDGAG